MRTYTIVIQAGKWQRQFSETVAAGPLTGLVLNMPANHTQGNIPMIAIATGSVDGAECVLRDMGISDSEFTDDTQTVNPGGSHPSVPGQCVAGSGDQRLHSVRDHSDDRCIDHAIERLRHGDVSLPGNRQTIRRPRRAQPIC